MILPMASERQRTSLASQTHRRTPRYAETQHSMGEAQALSLDRQGFNLTGPQPLPPDFLIAERVQLHRDAVKGENAWEVLCAM